MSGLFVVVETGQSSTLVRVRDDVHKAVMATFLYDGDGLIQSIEVSGNGITVGQMRELPLVPWEAAAFFHAFGRPAQPTESADSLVDRIHPRARERATTPAGRRHLDSLTMLATAAVEYGQHVAGGVRDPAAEVARAHNVSRATARSWIHRARAAGFLPRARGPLPSQEGGGVADTTVEQTYGGE